MVIGEDCKAAERPPGGWATPGESLLLTGLSNLT